MIKLKPIAILVLTSLMLSACSPAPENRLLKETTELHILPGYRDFALSSQQLLDGSRQFCLAQQDRAQTMDTLRQLWRNTVTTWAAVQSLQFGPLLVDNQAWKIQFWPDRKNLVARKVEGLLKGDETLDVDRVEAASVVVQGLSAMEYLLFDERAGQLSRYQEDGGQRRCQLLQSTAGHLHGVAAGLYEAWRPEGGNYAARFSEAGEGNPDYPDSKMALTSLLGSLVFGLEMVQLDKLKKPLGLVGGKPQIYLLEWWRSRYSLEALTANLNSLEGLYRGGTGYGLDDYLAIVKSSPEITGEVDRLFKAIHQQAAALEGDLFNSATDENQRQKAAALADSIGDLEGYFKREIPKIIGVTLSFNSNDGD